jgi:hypothetical protein
MSHNVHPFISLKSADYLRLAQALLGHPDWVVAEGLLERARQRVRVRLIDAAPATTAARPGMGEASRGPSND